MRATRVLVGAAVVVGAVRLLLRRGPRAGRAVEELRYRVPAGQDPAAVLATLRTEGLSARPDHVTGEPLVVIHVDTPGGRERVREIVRSAPQNMEGDPHRASRVSFTDEP